MLISLNVIKLWDFTPLSVFSSLLFSLLISRSSAGFICDRFNYCSHDKSSITRQMFPVKGTVSESGHAESGKKYYNNNNNKKKNKMKHVFQSWILDSDTIAHECFSSSYYLFLMNVSLMLMCRVFNLRPAGPTASCWIRRTEITWLIEIFTRKQT